MKKGIFIISLLMVTLMAGAPAWSGEDLLQDVKELNREVIRLYQLGCYAEAIPWNFGGIRSIKRIELLIICTVSPRLPGKDLSPFSYFLLQEAKHV